MHRARLLAVVLSLAAGALGVISSTQTWLVVSLKSGGEGLPVPGAAAIPVLAPLSLAVLALGAALSIAGVVLRYVFAVLGIAIGGVLAALTAEVAIAPPTSAVASTITDATGITGQDAIVVLVASITPTAWPVLTFIGWVALIAAGALTIATAHRWRRSGRRYRSESDPSTAASTDPTRSLDAIDSWDDLSRGQDPTG